MFEGEAGGTRPKGFMTGGPRRLAAAGVVVGAVLVGAAAGAVGATGALDDHTTTPAPAPAADATAPAVTATAPKVRRGKARVTFTLSEHATVTVAVRADGASADLRSFVVQARAGTRSLVLPGAKLPKGGYVLTLSARDAMRNASAVSTASFRVGGR